MVPLSGSISGPRGRQGRRLAAAQPGVLDVLRIEDGFCCCFLALFVYSFIHGLPRFVWGSKALAGHPSHQHTSGEHSSETTAEVGEMHHGADDVPQQNQHELEGADSFCNGMPMVMGGMQGFSQESCVVLFFEQWQVTSATRMWLAAFGVFSLGISYEYLKALERETYERAARQLRGPGSGSAAQHDLQGACAVVVRLGESRLLRALLHGLIVTVAYLCMFVAMTFNPLLFLTQIFGFIGGHFLFGPDTRRHSTAAAIVAAGGDPCCD